MHVLHGFVHHMGNEVQFAKQNAYRKPAVGC